jgi:hypothetical protein
MRRQSEPLKVTSIKVPESKHKLWKELADPKHGGISAMIIRAMDAYVDSLYVKEEDEGESTTGNTTGTRQLG